MAPASPVWETLNQLSWPYTSLPTEQKKAALAETKQDLEGALADLRSADSRPGLIAYSLRRLEHSWDYGKESLDLHVDICLELWRLVQDQHLHNGLRRKSAAQLEPRLRQLRKENVTLRGMKPIGGQAPSIEESGLKRLFGALHWKALVEIILGRLQQTSRGTPVEPTSSSQHLAESMAGLFNELRYWTPASEVDNIIEYFSSRMDPSQKSIVLFGRLMLMLLPAEASAQLVKDERLFKWWDMLPRGANSRFSLMWTILPVRAAKVRWASGEPYSPEPVLPQDRLAAWLDLVAGTMCLPIDTGAKGELEPYTEDCQWAFLGKTTYRIVTKYFTYSLEPLQDPMEKFAEGSTWAGLEHICRRLAACVIHNGAWTWHVRVFISELCRGYYARTCRERYADPGCKAHESVRLTPACDQAFFRLVFPLVRDMLTLQTGGQDHLNKSATLPLALLCGLAASSPAAFEEMRSFLQEAVQNLADPMSPRHPSTLYLLTLIMHILVRTMPGLLLEAGQWAIQGVDATDPMKTMVSAGFFVNLFVQVPTLDLSIKDMPDDLPEVLREVLPVHPKSELVPGATSGDLQMITSMLPDLCHNLLERFLEYVQAQPKPSKKDAMAALDLAGPRLLSTALFLAVRQGEPSMLEIMSDRLVEWVSLTLLPNAVKAVGMLISAFSLASPKTAGKVIDMEMRKLRGDLSQFGESELLWHFNALGAAVRFGETEILVGSRPKQLQECYKAALQDKRKAVRKAGAKLLRRLLSGLTAPYSRDLVGDNTLNEALHRWAGARALGWPTPVQAIKVHEPTAEEFELAKTLCKEGIELVKSKAAGSDEDIYVSLCLIKSIERGLAVVAPDEREGEAAKPLISTLPNDLGPLLLNEFSEVLLELCPKLGSPAHPFASAAAGGDASNRPKLLCKALRLIVGIVKGERRPEIPDLLQIRGFDSGTVRNHVFSESFTSKVHFMGVWRDLSRVWYNWEVLTLMNRRAQRRPTGFKMNGVRKKLAELLVGYAYNANSMVSCVATEMLGLYLKVHYGSKTMLQNDFVAPLQEQSIAGSSIGADQVHLAEAALEGFARTCARLLVVSCWRRGVASALATTELVIRTLHAYTEEGRTVTVKPSSLTTLFELLSKWIGGRTATNPGDVGAACKVAGSLLAMLKKPGVHWRTKVCILAVVGPALRILHSDVKAARELDPELLRLWLSELLGCLASGTDLHPQLATLAVGELSSALRSALKYPGLPLDEVLQSLIPREPGSLSQVAKTLSALHQGFLGGESGAPAQADMVQCVVRACTGRVGVLHLAWRSCPSGQSWMVHSTFFQSYVALCTKRGDTHIVEEIADVLSKLQAQPKSEAEDHVVFLEILGGLLRAARRWPKAKQFELWRRIAPIAAEELKAAEEENVRNWRFLVYYVVIGPSRRLKLRDDKPSEDSSVLNLATFLATSKIESEDPTPNLPVVVASNEDNEASSYLHVTRLRLMLVLLSTLQRQAPAISDDARIKVIQGLIPALKGGIGHPYKSMREESAKTMNFAMQLRGQAPCVLELKTWLSQQSQQLGAIIREASKESDTSTACEGLVYVFLFGLIGRHLRRISMENADFLLNAAAADAHQLKMLALMALGALGMSPQRSYNNDELSQHLVALTQATSSEDANAAQRTRRLGSGARLLGATTMRHYFSFTLTNNGQATSRCFDALVELLGDSRVEVRTTSQSAIAPFLGLKTTASCKKMAKNFAAIGADAQHLDRAVHGLSALLRAAGSLGVPEWLGDVIEALSKVGQRPQAKKEVEKTVQAFMKQQQQSRDVWKRCQQRLTEDQMDLLKARQGTMSYYS